MFLMGGKKMGGGREWWQNAWLLAGKVVTLQTENRVDGAK